MYEYKCLSSKVVYVLHSILRNLHPLISGAGPDLCPPYYLVKKNPLFKKAPPYKAHLFSLLPLPYSLPPLPYSLSPPPSLILFAHLFSLAPLYSPPYSLLLSYSLRHPLIFVTHLSDGVGIRPLIISTFPFLFLSSIQSGLPG